MPVRKPRLDDLYLLSLSYPLMQIHQLFVKRANFSDIWLSECAREEDFRDVCLRYIEDMEMEGHRVLGRLEAEVRLFIDLVGYEEI